MPNKHLYATGIKRLVYLFVWNAGEVMGETDDMNGRVHSGILSKIMIMILIKLKYKYNLHKYKLTKNLNDINKWNILFCEGECF